VNGEVFMKQKNMRENLLHKKVVLLREQQSFYEAKKNARNLLHKKIVLLSDRRSFMK
jgi:protein subunit release factor B